MPDSSQPSDQTSSQSAVPASAPAANAAAAPAAAPASASAKPAEGAPAAAGGEKIPATADGQPQAAAAAPGPDAGKPAADPAAKPANEQAPGADGKPAAAPDAAQAAAPGVPETYVLPTIEGVEYNPAALTGMSPAFKEAGLTQAQVDKLVTGFLTYQQALPQAMLAADLETTMKDPTIGAMNWGRTQGYVNDALTAFTTPQFRKQLEGWGIANNLEFVRVFERIGRAMRGDDLPSGQPASAERESTADRIYGRKNKGNSGG